MARDGPTGDARYEGDCGGLRVSLRTSGGATPNDGQLQYSYTVIFTVRVNGGTVRDVLCCAHCTHPALCDPPLLYRPVILANAGTVRRL